MSTQQDYLSMIYYKVVDKIFGDPLKHTDAESDSEMERNPDQLTVIILERKNKELMDMLKKPSTPPRMEVTIRRDRILEDSYNTITPWFGKSTLLHAKIKVKFVGEYGQDCGGLTREWFTEISKQLVNPKFGLFRLSTLDNSTLIPVSYQKKKHMSLVDSTIFYRWFSGSSSGEIDRLLYYQFFGLIVGKAIYENQLMDCHFSRSFYKLILNLEPDFSDLEAEDPVYFKNIMGMMDYSVEDAMLDLTFSAEEQLPDGQIKTVDLKTNGRHVAVTDDNKFEYITLLVRHKLVDSIQQQVDAFKKGLFQVIPAPALCSLFDENELELLICGLPSIDVRDLKANTQYLGGYTAYSPQIRWFWEIVGAYSSEQKAKLLQFITGTTKVPPGGFANRKVTIIGIDLHNPHRLPSSATCFDQLLLPRYKDRSTLAARLLTAVNYASVGFGRA
mmetsp:Transcript_15912/g.26674  ORF Transcript_15912/g.26674 Transcript_15912/m.26674 type:complete len:445 (-) Transcript_15912:1914-3248(-)|eukprot:CAMPEP_0174980488 /NCGR_PEP_ID=MMETSP0004_2-20121128/15378_1 /TAXON_ID=420556 /ORGANISM="Ochromonas sp., Strain CCMP1393" /LENGTH=444 /DNA_ID=CAMNT_0016232159 /DNA_START=114 /DNA_END=1448 /DNA_ORIENTATION=-